jgi:hypothetical protein
MFQHINPDDELSPRVISLLDKLASQPNGLENGLRLVTRLMPENPQPQSNQQPTPEEAYRRRLIAIAVTLVKKLGIVNEPYFKGMSNAEILDFINQYSPDGENEV